jgi:hypothetical protein
LSKSPPDFEQQVQPTLFVNFLVLICTGNHYKYFRK